jgi:hypothetical protein
MAAALSELFSGPLEHHLTERGWQSCSSLRGLSFWGEWFHNFIAEGLAPDGNTVQIQSTWI